MIKNFRTFRSLVLGIKVLKCDLVRKLELTVILSGMNCCTMCELVFVILLKNCSLQSVNRVSVSSEPR